MSLDSQIQKLDDLMASMPALPAQARLRSQRRQIISSLYPTIQDFLNKNYSHERVCELIRSETGIEFKVKTLKKYLYEERLKSGGSPHPRGRRKRSSSSKPRTKATLHSPSLPVQDASCEPEPLQAEHSTAVKASAAQQKASPSDSSTASQGQMPETEPEQLPEPEFNAILRS